MMTVERGGIHRILESDRIYRFVQRLLGGYRDVVGGVFGLEHTEAAHMTGRLRVPYDHALVQAR